MIGISARIGLAVAAAALLPLLVALAILLPIGRELALQRAEVALEQHARRLDESLQAHTARAAQAASNIALDLDRWRFDPAQIAAMMETRLRINHDIHAVQVLLLDAAGGERLGLYLSLRGGQLQRRDFLAEGYAFASRPWFRHAMGQPEGEWTDAYFNDAAGGRDTVTYHRPLPAGSDHPPQGLVSVDLALDRLDTIVAALGPPPFPAAVQAVIDPGRRLLMHQDPRRGRSTRLPAGPHAPAGDDWLPVPATALNGEAQRLHDRHGALHLSVLRALPGRGYQVALAVPASAVLAPLQQRLQGSLVWLSAGIAALVLLALLGARRLSRPLVELAAAAERMAAGEFGVALPVSRRDDEIGALQRALERARATIAEKDAALDSAGERDRRLASELELARQIQLAMVPRDRVFLTDRRVATLAGALIPAKAVGGDFYNFFALGPGELFFAIGDVSDKGVPSALFAARLNALLGNHARHADSPAAALAAAAGELYRSNETGLFATVVVGQLGLDDGRLRLASAGHDPPLLRRPDGSREWLMVEAGPALGFEEQPVYAEWSGWLPPGGMLLLYTDGVTEAMTRDNDEFGRDRIEVAFERHEPATPQQAAQAIVADVAAFAAGAEPSDDLTLLALGLAEREH